MVLYFYFMYIEFFLLFDLYCIFVFWIENYNIIIDIDIHFFNVESNSLNSVTVNMDLDIDFEKMIKICEKIVETIENKSALSLYMSWLQKFKEYNLLFCDKVQRNEWLGLFTYQLFFRSLQYPFTSFPPDDDLNFMKLLVSK